MEERVLVGVEVSKRLSLIPTKGESTGDPDGEKDEEEKDPKKRSRSRHESTILEGEGSPS
jgi:hypothetical protein